MQELGESIIFMGTIAIEGMRFHAFHGYYEEEQNIGGEYLVDVYVETDFSKAAEKDEIKNTINYELVYEMVKMEMGIRHKLLETVVQKILNSIDKTFTPEKIKVRISKLNPPLIGKIDRFFIEAEKNNV